MEQIKVQMEVVTPMFIAGADPTKAELRAASLKGMLRYWWRALQAESDISTLKKKESEIFGSATDGEGRASTFSLRVAPDSAVKASSERLEWHPVSVPGKTFKVNILEYLAYGTHEYRKKEKRNVIIKEYLPPASKFHIYVTLFRPNYSIDLLKTLYVFHLFGGMGSKTRNGFGSVYVVNAKEVFARLDGSLSVIQPYTSTNLRKLIRMVDTRPYSSFSDGTRVFATKNLHDTWHDALAAVGTIYRDARSEIEGKHHFEKRQFIGAPLDPPKEAFRSILDRHAKPYFMKVAKEGQGYRSYILYLPSLYCDGLEIGRDTRPISQKDLHKSFQETVYAFNELLAKKMEVIV